jgi:hypothetical protein
MLSEEDSKKALRRLFNRKVVADLAAIYRTLQTDNRMSVYRRLSVLGYLSSYTHRGRYYTLKEIPDFDEYGLWWFSGIGFSRYATLRATLVALVSAADLGMKQGELQHLVRVRVQDSLLSLVRAGRIGRKYCDGAYLYVTAEADRAREQLLERTEHTERTRRVPLATVVQMLVEAIHAGGAVAGPREVAARLNARNISVSEEQVKTVFARYGLTDVKKTERFH